MSTPLRKPVTRQMPLVLDNRTAPRACDEVNVTIYPNRTIGFRVKRCRREVVVTLAYCYQMALAQEALRATRKPKTQRKVRKVAA